MAKYSDCWCCSLKSSANTRGYWDSWKNSGATILYPLYSKWALEHSTPRKKRHPFPKIFNKLIIMNLLSQHYVRLWISAVNLRMWIVSRCQFQWEVSLVLLQAISIVQIEFYHLIHQVLTHVIWFFYSAGHYFCWNEYIKGEVAIMTT